MKLTKGKIKRYTRRQLRPLEEARAILKRRRAKARLRAKKLISR